MNTQPDFEELLKLLEQNEVIYMIVGGYAVAFHGYPRFTKDIDIFYKVSTENIQKLRQALFHFGFPESELPEELFTEEGNIIQFGLSPVRIDLLNKIDGIEFEDAERGIILGKYGNQNVKFIGRQDLIRNKRATGRLQDQADAENLEI